MRALLTVTAFLIVTAPAGAATIAARDGVPNAIEFTAEQGETNEVSVTVAGVALRVQDLGAPLATGAGCEPVDSHTATCDLGRCDKGSEFPGASCSLSVAAGDLDDLVASNTDRFNLVQVTLGDGNDDFRAGGTDSVVVDGGAGADHILGGDGHDDLIGGAGPDFVQGRGGGDTALYNTEGRRTPVTVTLDGQANDGAPGEGDNVQTEGIEGTGLDDHFVGNFADNFFQSDGEAEVVCGAGTDLVYTAAVLAAARDCESVHVFGFFEAVRPLGLGKVSRNRRNVLVRVHLNDRQSGGPGNVKGTLELLRRGRRLGRLAIDGHYSTQTVPVPLTRPARRLLRRRGSLRVLVEGRAVTDGRVVGVDRRRGTLVYPG